MKEGEGDDNTPVCQQKGENFTEKCFRFRKSFLDLCSPHLAHEHFSLLFILSPFVNLRNFPYIFSVVIFLSSNLLSDRGARFWRHGQSARAGTTPVERKMTIHP